VDKTAGEGKAEQNPPPMEKGKKTTITYDEDYDDAGSEEDNGMGCVLSGVSGLKLAPSGHKPVPSFLFHGHLTNRFLSPPAVKGESSGLLATLALGKRKTSKGGMTEVTTTINETGTLVESAALIAAVFTANPTGFPDWSSFAALFAEVKLVSYRITFVQYRDPAWTNIAPIMVAYFPSNTSVPSLYTDVHDGDPLIYYAYDSREKNRSVSMPVLKSLGWAPSASPVVGPYAGCPGVIKLICGPVSTGVSIGFHVRAEYRLRGRI